MKEVGLHFTGGENLIDRILNQWPLHWVIFRSINAQTPEKVYHSSGLSCMSNASNSIIFRFLPEVRMLSGLRCMVHPESGFLFSRLDRFKKKRKRERDEKGFGTQRQDRHRVLSKVSY